MKLKGSAPWYSNPQHFRRRRIVKCQPSFNAITLKGVVFPIYLD
jgi:hypothetical protein